MLGDLDADTTPSGKLGGKAGVRKRRGASCP
jgi:hypothetical protein